MALTLKTSEKISLIGSLSTMLAAGIPIFEVVHSLAEDARGNQKKVLDTLSDDLAQGKRVYSTFAKFPRVFDKVTVNVIRASEEAGTLDVTLKDLRDNIRREAEFADKIRAALIYPIFILAVFGAVLIMVLFLVVPKVAVVFKSLKIDLPLPTRILIFLSDQLINNGIIILAALTTLVIGLVVLFRTKRNLILGMVYSLPIISKLVQQIDLTRFARSLHLLLTSGIPITAALDLVTDVVIRKDTADVIAKSKEMVLAGKPLSAGFAASKTKIPTIMIKLIEAGEQTGTLDESMQEIQEHFDY